MRFAQLFMIATIGAVAASLSIGCDQSDSNTGSLPPSSSSNSSGRPTTTRRALPTTDEIFGRLPSSTGPSTTQSAGTPTSSQSSDPLATPESAVANLFSLMEKEDALGVRAMMADPSMPLSKLRTEVSAAADRLHGGAKWEIVQSHTDGVAALVIFRTTFPDGRSEITPLVLINRYERWKVLMGTPNPKKFGDFEKADINKVLAWAVPRLTELRGGSTTKPTTAATTNTTG